MRILNKLWEAMADPAGVTAHRMGGFERISWILDDWEAARANQADVEQRMTEALDQLGLTGLATSIHGLSPVGAAAILAETGDLTRFTSARAIVKLAGLAPRERLSGTFAGKARLSGAGRPGLRTAAWRAVWGCLHANDVYAARYRHLTGREHNKLKPTQAQTVLAAALLRQLWAVITTGQEWDPAIAANGLAHLEEAHVA
jgi:transposase